MKLPRFTLKTLLIGIAAVGLLLAAWPPYRFVPGPFDQSVGFQREFWVVALVEALALWLVWLVRVADRTRRELDKID